MTQTRMFGVHRRLRKDKRNVTGRDVIPLLVDTAQRMVASRAKDQWEPLRITPGSYFGLLVRGPARHPSHLAPRPHRAGPCSRLLRTRPDKKAALLLLLRMKRCFLRLQICDQ
jgi:hypothetical protein